MEYLLALGPQKPTSDVELAIVLDGIRMVETLVAMADDHNSKSENWLLIFKYFSTKIIRTVEYNVIEQQ